MKKQLIIGLGSGRCGTTSLYKLLNSQKNSFICHESKPLLTWIFDEKKIDNKLKKILSKDKKYIGDVASYYLQYIEHIISKNPSTKFIILKRPKEEVVKSFINKTKFLNFFKWNLWIRKPKKKENKWSKMFPKYNLNSKEEAIAKYWEEYYSKADKLIKKYPLNIKIFNTSDLNSEQKVKEILDFCNISAKDKRIKYGIKVNKTKELFFWTKYLFLWRADKL